MKGHVEEKRTNFDASARHEKEMAFSLHIQQMRSLSVAPWRHQTGANFLPLRLRAGNVAGSLKYVCLGIDRAVAGTICIVSRACISLWPMGSFQDRQVAGWVGGEFDLLGRVANHAPTDNERPLFREFHGWRVHRPTDIPSVAQG